MLFKQGDFVEEKSNPVRIRQEISQKSYCKTMNTRKFGTKDIVSNVTQEQVYTASTDREQMPSGSRV